LKVQWSILLFIICLNLATGLCISLSVPGSEYVQASLPGGNASDYESHFNSTDIVDSWQDNIIRSIPILGDIFSGVAFLFRNIQYLIDGFPTFLNWISDTYLVDAGSKTAFAVISNALRAMYVILMAVFAIEFLSGRNITE